MGQHDEPRVAQGDRYTVYPEEIVWHVNNGAELPRFEYALPVTGIVSVVIGPGLQLRGRIRVHNGTGFPQAMWICRYDPALDPNDPDQWAKVADVPLADVDFVTRSGDVIVWGNATIRGNGHEL